MNYPSETRFRILVFACLALLPAVALASTPNVSVFTVADDGEGPLEVKIIVRASNADSATLFCKLSTWGDDGPYEDQHYFTLDPPYGEVVFTHTYEAASADYHPTVRCQDEGVSESSSPVTVRNPITNGEPYATLVPPAGHGDAAYPVPFTLQTFDPDGEPLSCLVDFGEFGVEPRQVTVEAPYGELELPYTYSRPSVTGNGYDAKVLCSDGNGGTAFHTVNTDVVMSPGNSSPTFLLRRVGLKHDHAPRTVDYTLKSINDPNSDVLDCYFDGKDGEGRQPFTIAPPYGSRTFTAHYTVPVELDFPIVSCTDGHGGHYSSSHFVGVHEAEGNNRPQVAVTPSLTSGASPLAVEFSILAQDPDGDTLNCKVDYGFGEPGDSFVSSPPYPVVTLQHTFDSANSYQVSVECGEENGGISRDAVWIVADPYQGQDNYDPIMRFTASPDSGKATLGVSFFVTGFDPDGDDVTCDIEFGDGSFPRTVVLRAPLYSQQWTTHTYFTAATTPYPVEMTCIDGNGGQSTRMKYIQVDRAESNEEPVIQQFAADVVSGLAPLNVGFSLTATDSDSGVVSCTLDYGDGSSSNWRMSVPLSTTPSHTYEAGTYEATLYCCDDTNYGQLCGPDNVGVAVSTIPIDVGGVNRDPSVEVSVSTTEGIVPLRLTFELTASDPDGDDLSCRLEGGAPSKKSSLVVSSPYPTEILSMEFPEIGSYAVHAVCDDGNGGAASTAPVEILVARPGGGRPDDDSGSGPDPRGGKPGQVSPR